MVGVQIIFFIRAYIETAQRKTLQIEVCPKLIPARIIVPPEEEPLRVKVLQVIVVLFAIVGCLALALGGFYIYTVSRTGGFKFSNPLKTEVAQTTAPLTSKNPEYAALLKDYQPTPAPVVANAAAPVAPGQPAVAAAAVATPAQRPIQTPGPDDLLIREWPTGRKWVCLTFDDGPHPTYTPKFIDFLKSKNVKATFFLIGPEVKKSPDLARELHENGFELGNHTMTHPNFKLAKFTPDKIFEELNDTSEIIKQYSGQKEVTLMRPPYGYAPKKVRDQTDKLGLKIITWSIDTDDWSNKTTADEMTSNIMKNLKDGSIILMHDRFEKSLETTERVVDLIRAEGYTFVTVSELLGLSPWKPGPADIAAAKAAGAPAVPATVGAPAAPAAPSSTAPPVPGAVAPAAPAAAPAQTSQATLPAPGIPAATSTPAHVAPSKMTTLPAMKDKF
jgi:peptidoglycan/xylan/chitin deacetylase (PgdA/CDA1 family)